MDLGQSGARIRFGDKEFTTTRAKLAGENPVDSLRAIFTELPNLQSDVVALSLTGFNGQVVDEDSFGALCKDFFGAKEVAVIDDGLAGYIGTLSGRPGVTLLVGGGVVSVGGKDGNFSHRDGLGSIFGDEGSGYWLGKNGLTRALATAEHRDFQNDLLDCLKNEVDEFYSLKSKNGTEGAELAIKSAKSLLRAADLGIQSALQIRNLGAQLLARTVEATWYGVQGSKEDVFEVVIDGGLAKNQGYKESIKEEIRLLFPNCKFTDPEGDNLSGAIWIAKNMKLDNPPMLRWAKLKNGF